MIKEGYKASRLGEIPNDWEICQLKDVAKINMGSSPPSYSYNEKKIGLPFFQGNADFGYLYPEANLWCEAPQKVASKDDILISVRAPVGELNIAPYKCCIGRGLTAIRGEKVNNKFLYYFLENYSKLLKSFSQGSTFSAVTKKVLKNFPALKPSNFEQKKIADILSTVDENIEKTEEVIEKTKELKEGLMQDLFTRGILNNNLRLPPHEKQSIYKNTYLGFKPKDWINYQINEIAETDYGLNSAINKSLTAGIKMISVGNVNKDGTLDLNDINYAIEEKISPEDILIKSDILFNWRNGSKEHLGKTVFFDLNDKYTHVGLLIRIRTINNKSIYSKFLYYFLRYIHYKGYFTRAKKQVNNTFNKTELNDLQVFIPPLSEQKKIANILSTVDEKIQKEEEYKEKLELLKKGLMQKLLTGEVRVKVAN